MAMGSKDYVALAGIIHWQREEEAPKTLEDEVCKKCINSILSIVARNIADYCEKQNKAFDRKLFLDAAGVE